MSWPRLAVVAVCAPPVAAGAGLALLRWRYSVVTVRGPSMEPVLADGDRLLARRCGAGRLRSGQLVVFREPGFGPKRPAWATGAGRNPWVVKRVAAVSGDWVPEIVRGAVGNARVVPPRSLVVLGTSPESRDSRVWGFIPAGNVLGTVVRRL